MATLVIPAVPSSTAGPSPFNSKYTALGSMDFGAGVVTSDDGLTIVGDRNVEQFPSSFAAYFYFQDTGALPTSVTVNSVKITIRHRMRGTALSPGNDRYQVSAIATGKQTGGPAEPFDGHLDGKFSDSTYVEWSRQWFANPQTGSAWNRAEIFEGYADDGQFFILTTIGNIGPELIDLIHEVDQAFLTIDYEGSSSGASVGGFYESLSPGIRAGEEATPKLTNPGPARGLIVESPFTEANPFWGFPGTAVAHNNKLIYAVGGYTIGTDLPSIRVWDGATDAELCKIPRSLTNEVPKGITFLLRYFTTSGTGVSTVFTYNILVGTWDGGTTASDVHGRVFKLNPDDGALTVIGDSIAAPLTGHIPYAADFDGSHIWLGTHRGVLTSSGRIYKATADNPAAWTLDRDLTGTGQAAVVSIGARAGFASSAGSGDGVLMMFGAIGQTGTAGLLGDRDAFGVYTVADTGTQTGAGNGYYGLQVWAAASGDTNPYIYVAYFDPTTNTTLIRRRQALTGTTFSTVYTGAGSTQDHIISLVSDQSTLYAIAGSRTSNVYSGFVLFTRDGTTWTNATADLPLNTGDLAGSPLSSRAFTNAVASIAFAPQEDED